MRISTYPRSRSDPECPIDAALLRAKETHPFDRKAGPVPLARPRRAGAAGADFAGPFGRVFTDEIARMFGHDGRPGSTGACSPRRPRRLARRSASWAPCDAAGQPPFARPRVTWSAHVSPAVAPERTPMTDWLHAEYRDFDVVPRAMLCTSARGTYYFVSRFDAGSGAYADSYEVFRSPPVGRGRGLPVVVRPGNARLERLPDIPVRNFPLTWPHALSFPMIPSQRCSGNENIHCIAARRERRQGQARADGGFPQAPRRAGVHGCGDLLDGGNAVFRSRSGTPARLASAIAEAIARK